MSNKIRQFLFIISFFASAIVYANPVGFPLNVFETYSYELTHNTGISERNLIDLATFIVSQEKNIGFEDAKGIV